MIGAILGDIVGSSREFKPIKTTDFKWIPKGSAFTDDSILSLATLDAVIHQLDFAATYKHWGTTYPSPKGAYGVRFKEWLLSDSNEPYGSYGNGAPMRISPIGWLNLPLDEVLILAEKATACTHNHPEAIKASKTVVEAIWRLNRGAELKDVIPLVANTYGYSLDKSLAEMRPDYRFDESSQGTMPAVLRCLLESKSMESAIRNAVSLGGDADTLASITGALAEVAYPADYKWVCQVLSHVSEPFSNLIFKGLFDDRFRYISKYDVNILKTIQGYKNTRYEIHWNDGIEVVLIDSKPRMNKTTIGIITGYNPHSQILPKEENEARNASLIKKLEEFGCTCFNAFGTDPTGEWEAEKSFAVLGLTKAQITQLAVEFNQHAVVFMEEGMPPELVWCS
jgi:ADP-ribosylglycohydrolase